MKPIIASDVIHLEEKPLRQPLHMKIGVKADGARYVFILKLRVDLKPNSMLHNRCGNFTMKGVSVADNYESPAKELTEIEIPFVYIIRQDLSIAMLSKVD